MTMFPCKKCPACNFYSNLNLPECECGADLRMVPAELLDLESLPEIQRINIDTALPVFFQKCIVCGTVFFTDDPSAAASRCCNCSGTRFQPPNPELYVVEKPEEKPKTPEEPVKRKLTPTFSISDAVTEPKKQQEAEPEGSSFWGSLLGNSQQAASGIHSMASPSTPHVQPEPAQEPTPAEEEAEVMGWGDILGNQSAPVTPTPRTTPVRMDGKAHEITLTAIRFGQHSFTLQPNPDQSYLLGREALEGSFLSQDIRVGRKHCYLFFRSGVWYVQDNNSSNGTAVDGKDIGCGGTRPLQSGNLLKLGHHQNSMEFRVLIT